MDGYAGQVGLTRIRGFVGWWVGLGQHLIGDSSRFTHAFVVIGDDVVEAMPGGARRTPLSVYTTGERAADTIISNLPLTDEQRLNIVCEAEKLIGTPYSFADYVAIALEHWGIRPPRLRRYIADSGHLICSALVDRAFERAGLQLFDDGRTNGDVTPGDLAGYLIRNGGGTDVVQGS